MKKKIIFLLITFVLLQNIRIEAQDLTNELKVWSGISVSLKINENLKAKLSELLAIKMSPVGYSFSQTKLGLSYKIVRRTYAEVGYVNGLFNVSNSLRRQGASPGIFNKLAVDRIYGNISYRHDLVKRLSLKHKIEYQYFFTDLDKYKTRSIYSARLIYNVRRSSLAPYLENQFYYYQGGIISNGIKRYRLKPGLSFKPIKDSSMGISIYYIFQNEFNTNPIIDNDYSVLGFNISFKIS
jgi:hypothetical protein